MTFDEARQSSSKVCSKDTTEAAAVRKCLISAILKLDGNATTVRIAKKLGYDDFEIKQKMDILHFHSSLFHQNVYDMQDEDQCLNLIFCFELKTGRTSIE